MDIRAIYLSFILAMAVLVLSGCEGCLIPKDECEKGHAFQREIRLDGFRDTLTIGDTIGVTITMPWVQEVQVRESEETNIIDLLDIDNLVFPLVMTGVQAPIGNAPDRDENSLMSGRAWAFAPDGIIPRVGIVLPTPNFGQADIRGDRTQESWLASFDLVFRYPGRYYVSFSSGSDNSPFNDRNSPDAIFLRDFTELGCREIVSFDHTIVDYEPNLEMVARAEAESRIKIRTNVRNVGGSPGFYLIVLE